MTRQTGVIDVSSYTTDAKFRNWGLTCSTALQASGLVKTSDTGQINWVTVSKPVATNTKAGYEIYRFADTLQSTKPIFIRVDYGSGGTASGNSPCTWLTIGVSTDGAGTITGLNTGSIQGFAMSATVSNTAMPYYFTHTTGGYALMHFGASLASGTPTYTNPGWWVIERSINKTTGAATGDGVTLMLLSYTASTLIGHSQYGLDFNTTTAFTTRTDPQTNMPFYFSAATGAAVPVGKCYSKLSAVYGFSGMLSYFNTDIAAATTFTASPFGVSHTYLAWGSTNNVLTAFNSLGNGGVNPSAGGSISGACIWED